MTQKSPFHDVHVKSGAAMSEYDGWLLPEHYGDPEAEYRAYREGLAVFDVSSRSRIRVNGAKAAELLNGLFTCNIMALPEGRQCHALLCNEKGGVVEDVWVQHQDKGFLLIGSPSNRGRLIDALERAAAEYDVKVTDETLKTAMVSLEGPRALELLKEKLPFDIGWMETNDILAESYFFMRFVVTLYDGPAGPGASLILPAKAASMAWDMLAKYGDRFGAKVAGMATREVLRIEAGVPACGAELTEETDPFAAGLAGAVDLAGECVGADALRQLAESVDGQRLASVVFDEADQTEGGIAAGQALASGGQTVGRLTSCCFSVGLGKQVGLAYIEKGVAAGSKVQLADRPTGIMGTVADLPVV